MDNKKNIKIFIGFNEVAGYNISLKKGFDKINIESIFIRNDHAFNYAYDEPPNRLIKYLRLCWRKKDTGMTNIQKIFWVINAFAAKILLFCWALIKYDVFIFGAKSSFFRFRDLPILKLFRKKIIYIFYGSESRPPYINGKCYNLPVREIIKLTKKQKKDIGTIEKYADIIISHPASAHFQKKKFIPFMRIGIPCLNFNNAYHARPKDDLRILHAPSLPEQKGTFIIRQTVEKIKTKGYNIKLIELMGKPNAEVLEELSKCDFVIDEIYSDAVMAGFAREAAFFGKPAIVGGYSKQYDWGNLSQEDIPPVLLINPDNIESALEQFISDSGYRVELGEKARKFVTGHWSGESVAERFLKLINGDFPVGWYYDPKQIKYLHGWGLPEHKAKELIGRVISCGGIESLQLTDKPELQECFLKFIQSSKSQ